MRTYQSRVTVVSGDVEFPADAELRAENAGDAPSEWRGALTVADPKDLTELLNRRTGMLLFPTGQEGDFTVDPSSSHEPGSTRVEIVGMGSEPF
ncbi:hypothetical protein LN042_01775 [Kitasatospora sp. RB6PN24]|uniref:hypothetical protein n=1 Tax=Kitasatospora humi TaxID=2893891 RepID=UPI001E3EAC2A|nr:hypothetical protein [Kitasatospora humi]MCC9305849.1 hypothetical protein [Kitasatospora humi]